MESILRLDTEYIVLIGLGLTLLSTIKIIFFGSYYGFVIFLLSLSLFGYGIKKILDVYGYIVSSNVVLFLFNMFRVPFLWNVHNILFFNGVLKNPSLGFGEGYMHGLITPRNGVTLKDALFPIINSDFTFFMSGSMVTRLFGRIIRVIMNLQNITLSRRVAEVHYDLGNDLYEHMTGQELQYSCGFFPKGIRSLDDAQRVKIRLTLKKLCLDRPNLTLLDIGCGFGTLLKTASELYNVVGVGLSLSQEQINKAIEKNKNNPNISFHKQDYRTFLNNQIVGRFKRIVSVGMFEHVGRRNYNVFFNLCRRVIADDGIFVLHTICSNTSNSAGNPFIEKYIFPGGELPSVKEVLESVEPYFTCVNMSNYGQYYAITLKEWNIRSKSFFENIDIGENRKYNDVHRRMWDFYLTSCELAFELGRVQLVQFVFTPLGGIKSVIPHYDTQDVYDSNRGIFIDNNKINNS